MSLPIPILRDRGHRATTGRIIDTVTLPSLLETGNGLPKGVQGAADPHFSRVLRLFAQLFPGHKYGGGALCVYIDGELIDYDEPVAEYWPEFGANGKSDITVRDVLRHRSGLSHLKGVSKAELMDHLLMEQRLAAAPVDHLKGAPAYHALTYGWLLSGLARAVTGKGMRDLIRSEVARPLNTDGLHLGRPPAGAPTKVAQILAPQSTRPNPLFNFVAPKVAGLPFSGALGSMYFPGIKSLVQGDIPFLDGEIPAANGVVTSRGLAKMYAALANDGRIDGKKFLSSDLARGLAGKPRALPDLNMVVPMPFHLGYHESPIPGLLKGFGHVGLGGTLG